MFGETNIAGMINNTEILYMDRSEMKTIIENCSKTRLLRIYSATSKYSGPLQNIAIAILWPDLVSVNPVLV